MKIRVFDKEIETQDITEIHCVERDKNMFLGRDAGFIIKLANQKPIVFKERIPYESTPGDIGDIKDEWKKKMNQVIELWEKDKSSIPTIN